jgi:hypothetical protein
VSGVDTRPVPVNIMAWPRVRDLISQQKFIYTYMYYSPDATACGCYLFSLDRCAADMSMTAASLDDALDEFSRRGLVLRDKSTGEIFVVDWPRWHRFSTPAAWGALWTSIGRIQSRELWIKVENAYKSIPSPSKGKEKGKSISKEILCAPKSSVRLPPGWNTSLEGLSNAARLCGLETRPGESAAGLQQRILSSQQAQPDQAVT